MQSLIGVLDSIYLSHFAKRKKRKLFKKWGTFVNHETEGKVTRIFCKKSKKIIRH
jgi:hypothetical protein